MFLDFCRFYEHFLQKVFIKNRVHFELWHWGVQESLRKKPIDFMFSICLVFHFYYFFPKHLFLHVFLLFLLFDALFHSDLFHHKSVKLLLLDCNRTSCSQVLRRPFVIFYSIKCLVSRPPFVFLLFLFHLFVKSRVSEFVVIEKIQKARGHGLSLVDPLLHLLHFVCIIWVALFL